MQLIKAVWPIDGVRSRERHTGLCPSREPRQELHGSLQQSTGLHPGAPRAGMKQKKFKPFSGMFSVPREVPAMTCELLLETLCRLARCFSCEGVASLSVF